jgi:RNA polymerase sigma-70 factor (ECF subfamily)
MAFPTLDAATETRILDRARGDAEGRRLAGDEIFRSFRAPVLGLCLHLTGRRSDAEDAVQEVFLAVHRALPRFRGEARLSTWVYRIAIRAALAQRGAHGARPPDESLDESLSVPSGEADLIARDRARRLVVAMDQLAIEHRTILSLFAVEGMSHKEISDVLGIPEGTVWSRLHAARKELAHALSVS